MISTITFPLSLDVVIAYGEKESDRYVFSWERHASLRHTSAGRKATDTPYQVGRFKMFREMYGGRGFRLVLCPADVHDCIAEYAMWALERAAQAELEGGTLDYLLQGPLIISEIRTIRSRCTDDAVGSQTKWPIRASAL